MQTIKQHAIDGLSEYLNNPDELPIDDLHYKLFNEDYFIVGVYNAKQFFKDNDIDVFDAIGEIKEYEEDRFGEVTTDLSCPEKVVNMYAYIHGEAMLQEIDYIQDLELEEEITEEHIKKLIEEINNY